MGVLTFIYLVAITAEAMSGALAAGRRRMDIFGVAVVAFVTALGGGTVRDLILGHFPIGWTQHPTYIYLVIGAGLLTVLVAFSLIGCDVALQMDYPVAVVIMAGMITGIFGGILRDVLCAQVPVVFQREIYAMVSLAVCMLFLGLRALGVDPTWNTVISLVTGLSLRLAAIYFSWSLPTFAYDRRWD